MIDKETAKKVAKANSERSEIEQFQSYVYRTRKKTAIIPYTDILIHPIERNGRLRLSILINENTTIEAIRSNWWYINEWREALIEWQGTVEKDVDLFHKKLSDAQKHGISYNELAKQTNLHIVKFLKEYAIYQRDYDEALTRFENKDEFLGIEDGFLEWLNDYSTQYGSTRLPAFKFADDLLRYCRPRLNDNERKQFLNDALDKIRQNEPPFLPGEPIGREDIRGRVKTWREKQKDVENIG